MGSMIDVDDMALALATAEANRYHERSPSMLMIVVPLEDGSDEEEVYCDELNASYYEFFREEDDDQDDAALNKQSSPRSVLDIIDPLPMAFKPCSGLIPNLTDLMRRGSHVHSASHRRSRNQAKTDFPLTVLPHLEEALKEYHDNEKEGLLVCPFMKDRREEPAVPASGKGAVEVEC